MSHAVKNLNCTELSVGGYNGAGDCKVYNTASGTLDFDRGDVKMNCLNTTAGTFQSVLIDSDSKLWKGTVGGGGTDPQTALNTAAIATNETDIATNSTDIGTNSTDIGTNTTAIGTNTTNIANKVDKSAVNVISADNQWTGLDDVNKFNHRVVFGTSDTDGVVVKKDQIAMIDGVDTWASITPTAINLNTDTLIGTSSDDGKTCTIRAGGAMGFEGLMIESDTHITGTCKLEGNALLYGVVTQEQGQVPTSLLAADATSQAIQATISTANAQNPMTNVMGFNAAGEILKDTVSVIGNVVGSQASPQPNEIYWSGRQHMTYHNSSAVTLELGDPQGANDLLFNCNGRGQVIGEFACDSVHTSTSSFPMIFGSVVPDETLAGTEYLLMETVADPGGGADTYRMVKKDGNTVNETFTGTVTVGAIILDKGIAPSSSSDTGTEGMVRWAEVAGAGGGVSSYYMYVCVATNTWRRQVLDDWQ